MVELVGILNVTPDSFSDGGQFLVPEAAIKQARKLFSEGASLVDVGAESTRPNAEAVDLLTEWSRLEPVLKALVQEFPGRISLDSYHPKTVEKALGLGLTIVNDITGMNNPAMIKVIARHKPTVIVSHLPGTNVQEAHKTMPINSLEQVRDDLLERAALLEQKGLKKDQIILDPGIGFGKTPEINSRLLEFSKLVPSYAVMIGYSRKRFLGEQRMELEPNLQAGRIAITAGAKYLRVHDVAGHQQILIT